MTAVLIAVLVLLAVLTAYLLGGGWMSGMALGMIVFVPFCFSASLLFAKLIGLDKRIRQHDVPPSPPTESNPREQ